MPFFNVGNRDWDVGDYEAEDADDALDQARDDHPEHAHRALHARPYAWGFTMHALAVEAMRDDGTWDRMSEAQRDRWYADGPRVRRRTMREAWQAWAPTQGLVVTFVGNEHAAVRDLLNIRVSSSGRKWYDPIGADMFGIRRIWLLEGSR